jgi:hypothetical protein
MEEAVKEGITFEQIKAMFKDIAESQRETDSKFKETDLKFKETEMLLKENAQQFAQQHKETERIVKQNSKQIGGLHRRFGELAEHLVAPGIAKRFNELGYHFHLVAKKGGEITDENGKTLTQIDILLENNKLIIAVEVKTRPVEKDVAHHIKRLEILRDTLKKTKREVKILGAIAGAIYDDSVKDATRDAGFFVIEQSGDTMKIDMPDGWVPKTF